MEKIYTVKTTSQAEEQMQEIIHYIAYELKAPDAALHLLDAMEDIKVGYGITCIFCSYHICYVENIRSLLCFWHRQPQMVVSLLKSRIIAEQNITRMRH